MEALGLWQCLPLLYFSFVCILGPNPNWQHPFALAEPVPAVTGRHHPWQVALVVLGLIWVVLGVTLTGSTCGGDVNLASIQWHGAFVQM